MKLGVVFPHNEIGTDPGAIKAYAQGAALVAKQAAELAILSGNRFRLGIGTGWNEVEYEALDVPFARRGKRQEEQVDLLRQLWESDNLTYGVDFHTVTRASILPRPDRPVPVWFGGGAPALLKRCALIGDGWVLLGRPGEGSTNAIRQSARTAKKPAWPGTASASRRRPNTAVGRLSVGRTTRWERSRRKPMLHRRHPASRRQGALRPAEPDRLLKRGWHCRAQRCRQDDPVRRHPASGTFSELL